MATTFAVHLKDSDQKLVEDFQRFLESSGIGPDEVAKIVSDFGALAIPQINRIRSLAENGSNVDFARSFDTSAGRVTVALNTSPKSLLSRITGLFGR